MHDITFKTDYLLAIINCYLSRSREIPDDDQLRRPIIVDFHDYSLKKTVFSEYDQRDDMSTLQNVSDGHYREGVVLNEEV